MSLFKLRFYSYMLLACVSSSEGLLFLKRSLLQVKTFYLVLVRIELYIFITGFFMTSIPEFMTAKHRECDELFTEAEAAVAITDWSLALNKWQGFVLSTLAKKKRLYFPSLNKPRV